MTERGRVMAIDYGEKRIGLALSDPTRTIASPLDHIVRRAGKRPPLAEIIKRASANEVTALVIGLPLDQEGDDTPRASEVRLDRARAREAHRDAGDAGGRALHHRRRAAHGARDGRLHPRAEGRCRCAGGDDPPPACASARGIARDAPSSRRPSRPSPRRPACSDGAPAGAVAHVTIPAGASLTSASDTLEAHGVVASATVFRWFARLTGGARDIKAGNYAIRYDISWRRSCTRCARARGSRTGDGPRGVEPQRDRPAARAGARRAGGLGDGGGARQRAALGARDPGGDARGLSLPRHLHLRLRHGAAHRGARDDASASRRCGTRRGTTGCRSSR